MAARLSMSVLAAAAAVLLAAPALASDLDRSCVRENIGGIPAAMTLEATIDSIFNHADAPPVETASGVTVWYSAPEVLLIRVKDGKPVMACVDTKEAATRFLTAPVEKIGRRAAEEK